jgi:hypothetical protein
MSREQTSRPESPLHVSHGVVHLQHVITCRILHMQTLHNCGGVGANGGISLLALHYGPVPWSSWLQTQMSKVECKRPFLWKVTAQNIQSLWELRTSQVTGQGEWLIFLLSLIFGRVRIPEECLLNSPANPEARSNSRTAEEFSWYLILECFNTVCSHIPILVEIGQQCRAR